MQPLRLRLHPALAVTLLAFSLLSPAFAGNGANSTIVATLQTPPLRELSENIMGLARAVHPGQQTEMLPLLMLGAFGYPEYQGVSRTEDVSVFVFEGDEAQPMPFVILVKLDETSTMRQMLPMLEWFIEPHGDWVLISNDAASLRHVGDVDALIALNQRPRPFMLTLRSSLEPEAIDSSAAQAKDLLRQRHIEAAKGDVSEIELISKTRFVDFVADVLKNLDELDTGLEVSPAGLGMGMRLQARAGTPEAALLSAGSAGPVRVGRFIGTTHPLIYLYSIDPKPLTVYTESLFARARNYAGTDGREYLGDVEKAVLQWLQLTDGTAAGAMRFADDEPEVLGIVGGSITEPVFSQLLDEFYNNLMPRFFELIPYFEGRQIKPQIDYSGPLAAVAGVPVHRLTISVPLDGVVGTLPDSANESETYMAVVEGNVVSANTMDEVEALVRRVQQGTEASPSVASVISLAADEIYRFYVDLHPLAEQSLGVFGNMAAPHLTESIRTQLQDMQLEPLTGVATTKDGSFKLSAHLPASTLATLSKAYQEIQREMQPPQSQ